MNAQEYRKELLIQRIEANRGLVDLEVQRLKDSNPIQPLIDLGHDIAGVFGSLGSMVGGKGRRSKDGPSLLGLDLTLVVPMMIELVSMLLRKRKAKA